MARENEWGYARIQGELKKLDITISKSSVANTRLLIRLHVAIWLIKDAKGFLI
jgi:putative transposase